MERKKRLLLLLCYTYSTTVKLDIKWKIQKLQTLHIDNKNIQMMNMKIIKNVCSMMTWISLTLDTTGLAAI